MRIAWCHTWEQNLSLCSLRYYKEEGLPLLPSHFLPQDKRIMGTPHRQLLKAERSHGPGVVICCKLLYGGNQRSPRTEPPHPFLGRNRQGEEEKDRLFLHPQWDW